MNKPLDLDRFIILHYQHEAKKGCSFSRGKPCLECPQPYCVRHENPSLLNVSRLQPK
jgi:hypothetical protein